MRVNNRQVYNYRTMKKWQNPDWDVVWVGMGGVLHKLPLSISCLPRLTAPPSPPPAYTMDSTQNLHFHFLPIWPLLIYKVVWFPTTDQALENLKIMSSFPFMNLCSTIIWFSCIDTILFIVIYWCRVNKSRDTIWLLVQITSVSHINNSYKCPICTVNSVQQIFW